MTAAIADAGRDMKIELSAHLVPLQEQVTGGSRAALTLLLAGVGVVLLIVCVNLGNLMLVRANERARDAAIRRALGAGAGHLFRPDSHREPDDCTQSAERSGSCWHTPEYGYW